LSGILSNYGKVLPEENRIDIVFNDEWAISLKDRKTKVDKGRSNVLKNLNDLKEAPYNKYNKTCLVFLTFSPSGKKNNYDKKIEHALKNDNRIYYKRDFNFKNTKFKDNNEGRLWFIHG